MPKKIINLFFLNKVYSNVTYRFAEKLRNPNHHQLKLIIYLKCFISLKDKQNDTPSNTKLNYQPFSLRLFLICIFSHILFAPSKIFKFQKSSSGINNNFVSMLIHPCITYINTYGE